MDKNLVWIVRKKEMGGISHNKGVCRLNLSIWILLYNNGFGILKSTGPSVLIGFADEEGIEGFQLGLCRQRGSGQKVCGVIKTRGKGK